MWPRVPEIRRRFLRRLGLGAIGVLAPKCALCLLAYLGFGTALGRSGMELCGARGGDTMHLVAGLVIGSLAPGFGAFSRACGLGREQRRQPAQDRSRGACAPQNSAARSTKSKTYRS